MKILGVSISMAALLTACTLGASGWSPVACGCAPAWASLASTLHVDRAHGPEDLSRQTVQVAAARLIGQPLVPEQLPRGGPTDSCKSISGGAMCHWKLWQKGFSSKGYIAVFRADAHGTIVAVAVQDHTWLIDGGT